MLYLIIAVGAFIFCFTRVYEKGFIGIAISIYISFCLMFLATITFGLGSLAVGTEISKHFNWIEYDQVYIREMEAIQDHYYMTYRTTDEKCKYSYLYKDLVNDCYKTDSIEVSSDNVSIYEDTNFVPRVVCEAPEFKSKILKVLLVRPVCHYKYKIYVPKDAIKMNYNIDLD